MLALLLAQTLFLWMFFSADALEQVAAGTRLENDAATQRALEFAAAWRHGMTGNSPLYMPGFFAVAVASWLCAERKMRLSMLAATLVVSTAAAAAAAPIGSAGVLAMFPEPGMASEVQATVFPRWQAVFSAVLTLITWTAFVVGSRAALVRRSLVPLLPVPVLTIVLVLVRPWTVDEFTSIWWRGAARAEAVALVSAALVPVVGAWLYRRGVRDRETITPMR